MPARTVVIFWASLASAVFLLGGGIASARHAFGDGGAGDAFLLALSLVGFAAAVLVAGRIVFVSGRVQRRARGR